MVHFSISKPNFEENMLENIEKTRKKGFQWFDPYSEMALVLLTLQTNKLMVFTCLFEGVQSDKKSILKITKLDKKNLIVPKLCNNISIFTTKFLNKNKI